MPNGVLGTLTVDSVDEPVILIREWLPVVRNYGNRAFRSFWQILGGKGCADRWCCVLARGFNGEVNTKRQFTDFQSTTGKSNTLLEL